LSDYLLWPNFKKITEVAKSFGPSTYYIHNTDKNCFWATFWVTFSQNHLVALMPTYFPRWACHHSNGLGAVKKNAKVGLIKAVGSWVAR
jgi:hypothetical protein